MNGWILVDFQKLLLCNPDVWLFLILCRFPLLLFSLFSGWMTAIGKTCALGCSKVCSKYEMELPIWACVYVIRKFRKSCKFCYKIKTWYYSVGSTLIILSNLEWKYRSNKSTSIQSKVKECFIVIGPLWINPL